jgi:hypothetical protein
MMNLTEDFQAGVTARYLESHFLACKVGSSSAFAKQFCINNVAENDRKVK